MGSYFSQPEEEEIEFKDSDDSQQHGGSRSPLSKLFSFVNDPRSPGNFSRTPILVHNQLPDPRSPENDLVERTPLYAVDSRPVSRKFFGDDLMNTPIAPDKVFGNNPAIPISEEECVETEDIPKVVGGDLHEFSADGGGISAFSPYVKYKMYNQAYEHSPSVTPMKSEESGSTLHGDDDDPAFNLAYEESPISANREGGNDGEVESFECQQHSKIEDIPEEYDYEIIGDVAYSEVISGTDDCGRKEKPVLPRDNRLRKRFNANQSSILKTALFKPYNQLNEEEHAIFQQKKELTRVPLVLRHDSDNANVESRAAPQSEIIKDGNVVGTKLPLLDRALSIDKENCIL